MTGTLTMSGKWAEQALCAQADPDAWFPDKGGSTALAKLICAACPVRAQCLDYALSGADTWGGIARIWGGTTPRERAQLRHHPEGLPRDEQGPGPQTPAREVGTAGPQFARSRVARPAARQRGHGQRGHCARQDSRRLSPPRSAAGSA
jgi:WhiB family transcriptional regulator, redox-sensing transcriptional regulator